MRFTKEIAPGYVRISIEGTTPDGQFVKPVNGSAEVGAMVAAKPQQVGARLEFKARRA